MLKFEYDCEFDNSFGSLPNFLILITVLELCDKISLFLGNTQWDIQGQRSIISIIYSQMVKKYMYIKKSKWANRTKYLKTVEFGLSIDGVLCPILATSYKVWNNKILNYQKRL